MKFKSSLLLVCLLYLLSCTKNENYIGTEAKCISHTLDSTISIVELVSALPTDVVTALAEQPNSAGALGRNKDGYFHVRFQMDLLHLAEYAIKYQNVDALNYYISTLQYSFTHQKNSGDFLFVAPANLLESSTYKEPIEAELASATVFFAYSVGLSLELLQKSEWYIQNTSIQNVKDSIQKYTPHITNMLTYLKNSKNVLLEYDAQAPNRLLFDAIALYSLGEFLQDQDAIDMGISFATAALEQRNTESGYFIESDGWDSSYNGVAIKLAFELYTLLASEHSSLKTQLAQAVSCATNWQKSRILDTGEISTEGNTRVYIGGEVFLGNEKQVDYSKTVQAFYYMNTLSKHAEYASKAESIIYFYK